MLSNKKYGIVTKTIILYFLVPLPVVGGPIPIVASQANIAGRGGRGYVGNRVPGLTQAPNLNKRARTGALLHPDRDGSVGQATTLDGTGNSIQIKQEMKLDGEGSYEHAAAVASNSLHSGGFPSAGQPGQPTTVAAFNTYYETGAGTNAGKVVYGISTHELNGNNGRIKFLKYWC